VGKREASDQQVFSADLLQFLVAANSFEFVRHDFAQWKNLSRFEVNLVIRETGSRVEQLDPVRGLGDRGESPFKNLDP
jgi:hypothetical protein